VALHSCPHSGHTSIRPSS
jgi:hypothetical protein